MALRRAFTRVTIADGAARGVVRREHARWLCEGHFPGRPIVPGALLLEGAITLAPEPAS